jgi:hypothetical protein
MSGDDIAIRPVRENELGAVLRLWGAADVTPPSVTDSIEGLTCLTHEPGAILLVAITGRSDHRFGDRRLGRMARQHLSSCRGTRVSAKGCRTPVGDWNKQCAV